MRIPRLLPLLGLLMVSAVAQTASPISASSTTASTVVAQAIAAFSTAPVSQIQLSGTAKAYAGSLQPSGTFTATLKSTGESTLQLNLAELTRTETTGAYSSPPQFQWTGADGVQHDAPQHNCLLPLHWLVPVLALQNRVGTLTQAVAAATDQGTSVQALSVNQRGWDASAAAQKYAQLASGTLSLDAATALPTSFAFNIHPDNNERLDIPILVRYSDYRTNQRSNVALPHSEVCEQRTCTRSDGHNRGGAVMTTSVRRRQQPQQWKRNGNPRRSHPEPQSRIYVRLSQPHHGRFAGR